MRTPAIRVEERLVLTYRAQGKDCGLLVAFEWGEGFFCEHIAVFPDAPLLTLPRLLQAGMAEATKRAAQYVGVYIPKRGDRRLQALARSLGFAAYKRGPGGVYLVKYAEAA
jgi:hypothetical protein